MNFSSLSLENDAKSQVYAFHFPLFCGCEWSKDADRKRGGIWTRDINAFLPSPIPCHGWPLKEFRVNGEGNGGTRSSFSLSLSQSEQEEVNRDNEQTDAHTHMTGHGRRRTS